MTDRTDAQAAREVHRLYKELRPLLGSDAQRDLLDSLHRLVYTPPPTMGDIAWDDEVHAGLCAVYTAEDATVRMIARSLMYTDYIECCWLHAGIMRQGRLPRKHLTPLPGTRIDLTPLREPVSNEGVETGNENRNEGVETGNDAPRPRPQDVPVGEVWEVEAVGYGKWAGTRSNPGNSNAPWTLIRVDSCDYYWAKDDQVTLVRRLVPEAVHDHPTTLSSVEDYESAPVGTVVAYDGDVAVKRSTGRWYWTGQRSAFWAEDFADADPCTVVRWGK